jgi:hypothetical protein
MLVAEFFQQEVGAGTHEGVGWTLGGDHGLEMAIPRMETPNEIEHLAGLGDGLAEVVEAVGGVMLMSP